jgi:hypothetical protein
MALVSIEFAVDRDGHVLCFGQHAPTPQPA